jgi:hypothetical protein
LARRQSCNRWCISVNLPEPPRAAAHEASPSSCSRTGTECIGVFAGDVAVSGPSSCRAQPGPHPTRGWRRTETSAELPRARPPSPGSAPVLAPPCSRRVPPPPGAAAGGAAAGSPPVAGMPPVALPPLFGPRRSPFHREPARRRIPSAEPTSPPSPDRPDRRRFPPAGGPRRSDLIC